MNLYTAPFKMNKYVTSVNKVLHA